MDAVPAARNVYGSNRSEFYSQIKRINQLVQGISDGTMSHGEAWEFCQLGMYLERACQTARILDVKYHILLPTPDHVGTPVDNAHWVAILYSCSGYEPYLKTHRAADPSFAVTDFLVFDPLFPRSVKHCLRQCQKAAHAISGQAAWAGPATRSNSSLDSLLTWLNLMDINDVIRAGLHESLTSVVNRTHEIGDAIHRTYFDVRHQPPLPAQYAGRDDAGATAMMDDAWLQWGKQEGHGKTAPRGACPERPISYGPHQ